jgi:hypothetical protein
MTLIDIDRYHGTHKISCRNTITLHLHHEIPRQQGIQFLTHVHTETMDGFRNNRSAFTVGRAVKISEISVLTSRLPFVASVCNTLLYFAYVIFLKVYVYNLDNYECQ